MKNNIVIQINQHGMGHGENELSLQLIQNYFRVLLQEENIPYAITFYNSGVKLVVENSNCLEELAQLEKKGIKLIACKTCLKYYSLEDKLKVGIPGSMIDIAEMQFISDKIITL
jgi:selenium metabolism protein YedF